MIQVMFKRREKHPNILIFSSTMCVAVLTLTLVILCDHQISDYGNNIPKNVRIHGHT